MHKYSRGSCNCFGKHVWGSFNCFPRLMADDDVLNGIRMILLAGRSQWEGFNDMMSKLTTPEKSLSHCQDWAVWGWLRDLIACLQCLSDARGLSRCGIETEFTTQEIARLNAMSPEVRYQDALASRLNRFVFLIVSLRAGSLVERSHYYPFRLAALTSPSRDVAAEALHEFERDVRAWWAAKEIRFSY